MSDCLRPHGLQPARLLCLWDFLGKNTGMCSHFLLQRIFLTQGSNLGFQHCRQILFFPHTYHQSRATVLNLHWQQNHPEGMGLLEPKLRVSSDSEHLGCVWEFTFLTSSQVMWILLIYGPDFENHCSAQLSVLNKPVSPQD